MKGAHMKNEFGLVLWYQSQTMGNIVPSRLELVKQVFESLFKYKTIDIRWMPVWLNEG